MSILQNEQNDCNFSVMFVFHAILWIVTMVKLIFQQLLLEISGCTKQNFPVFQVLFKLIMRLTVVEIIIISDFFSTVVWIFNTAAIWRSAVIIFFGGLTAFAVDIVVLLIDEANKPPQPIQIFFLGSLFTKKVPFTFAFCRSLSRSLPRSMQTSL